MRTIHKYSLKCWEVNKVKMPMESDIISAGLANGQICIWAEVDTKSETSERAILVIGTGREINERLALEKIGTVVQPPLSNAPVSVMDLVWHVFEVL